MKFNDTMAIYIQIMDIIKINIINGEFSIGSQLPSMRKMANDLNVNQNTMMRVYNELEYLQLIYTKTGVGTFVINDINMRESLKNEMTKELVSNYVSKMKILGFYESDMIMAVKNYKG